MQRTHCTHTNEGPELHTYVQGHKYATDLQLLLKAFVSHIRDLSEVLNEVSNETSER